MPELPEVDVITGVVRKYADGNVLRSITVHRWNGKCFNTPNPLLPYQGIRVVCVRRHGKHTVFTLRDPLTYMVVHHAMTGYFDWEHEPWTFDYVEGARKSTDSDVRVTFDFVDGTVLRFHDARLFGRIQLGGERPEIGPELMDTPNLHTSRPIIQLSQFREGLSRSNLPIKHLLMDQKFLAGIGNIYSSEACHLAGVDPGWPAHSVPREQVGLLLEALRACVSNCIPKVNYDWLNVYRRRQCGSCGDNVHREEIRGRATFSCPRCQWEP